MVSRCPGHESVRHLEGVYDSQDIGGTRLGLVFLAARPIYVLRYCVGHWILP
uniref:Uncharacterized protein n=1 Tax=Arundo donax TaxID=35708 RepID=A0A0A9B1C0_ARUDO